MSRGFWTAERDARLRREYPTCASLADLAISLGVSYNALRARAHRLGILRRPFWSEEEKDTLRRLYGSVPALEVARQMGRTLKQVYQQADAMGLGREYPEQDRDLWRRLHAQGYSDEEIASQGGHNRHTVARWRRQEGLSANTFSERRIGRVREKTVAQLQTAGLSSLAEVRSLAFRGFADRHGWPADLRPRHVQILNLLAGAGVPLDRQQIAAGIGLPWIGSRKSLCSRDPEGSYLAHLAARGLVLRLFRARRVLGEGKGRTRDLYTLGPAALAILAQRAAEESRGEG